MFGIFVIIGTDCERLLVLEKYSFQCVFVGVAGNVCLTFTYPSRINFILCLLIAVFMDETRKQVEKGAHAITNLNEKYMAIEI